MSEFYLCDTEILGLSHSAVKIYSFLRMVNNRVTHESFYKRSNIAGSCHVSESTVVRSVRELRGKGLLKTSVRFLPDGQQTSNSYILIDNPQLRFDAKKTRPGRVSSPCANKPAKAKILHDIAAAPIRQFRCDPTALRTNLPPSALKVYSYLSFRAGIDGKTMPAKKEIAAGCGVSVSSVSRAIGLLSAAGLVEVRRQTRMETCGNNGNSVNLYVMLRPNHKWEMSRVLRNVLFPYPPVSSSAKCFFPFSDILPHVTGDTARTISRMKKKQRKEQYPINFLLRINGAGEKGNYSNSFFPCFQHIKQGAKKMNSIIGLPVIVSARYRIVINSGFRRVLGIPETGRVRLLAGRSSLQIFPGSAFAPNAQEKNISAGRFNLPMDWVKRNEIHVSNRVFLIAASDCILVRQSVRRFPAERKRCRERRKNNRSADPCSQFSPDLHSVRISEVLRPVRRKRDPRRNWGLPGFRGKGVVINTRAETEPERAMFRRSLAAMRCVIPSSSFFDRAVSVLRRGASVRHSHDDSQRFDD